MTKTFDVQCMIKSTFYDTINVLVLVILSLGIRICFGFATYVLKTVRISIFGLPWRDFLGTGCFACRPGLGQGFCLMITFCSGTDYTLAEGS